MSRLLVSFAVGVAGMGSGCVDPDAMPQVRIAEIMAANTRTLVDDAGAYSDWVELHNAGQTTASIQDWGLSDDDSNPYKWLFPYVVLAPGDRLVIFASNDDQRDPSRALHTNFRLRSGGEPLLLTSNDGRLIDRILPVNLPPDISWGLDESRDRHGFFLEPTPGEPNTGIAWPSLDEVFPAPLRINEVALGGAQNLVDEDNVTSDWIEVVNDGDDAVALQGYALTDDLHEPHRWRFPPMTIPPGAHLVIFASGKDRRSGELHTNFRIRPGETLALVAPSGSPIDVVSTLRSPSSGSLGRSDGLWVGFSVATPGAANTTAPTPDFSGREGPPKLTINEVMTAGADNPLGTDWVELFNTTPNVVDLDGIGLSDDRNRPFLTRLPPLKVPPRGFAVIRLTARACAPPDCRHIEVPLRLDSDGDDLVLTDPDGSILEELEVTPLEAGVSLGRPPDGSEARVLFGKPTPGATNSPRFSKGMAPTPVFVGTDIYVDIGSEVALHETPEGVTVRITRDGSMPIQRSRPYTGPIPVEKNMVVRARAFAQGMMPSRTATRQVLTGTPHPLPVTTIALDHGHAFNEKHGLLEKGMTAEEDFPHKGANYWSSRTLPVHFDYHTADGRLAYGDDVGFRVFGQWSRALDKKGFKLVARPRYGRAAFQYPFWDNRGPQETDDIVLRASGQDSVRTGFRDVLVWYLTRDLHIEAAAYQPTVLYINARYWGLYHLREHLDEDLLAERSGVADARVLVADGVRRSNPSFTAVRRLMKTLDPADPDALTRMEQLVDLDSYIDWTLITLFTANIDYGNCRYWRVDQPGHRWRWLLFDLDLSMMDSGVNLMRQLLEPFPGWRIRENRAMYRWLENAPGFRERFLDRASFMYREVFPTERVLGAIDHFLDMYEPELRDDRRRWYVRERDWESAVERLRRFARRRPARMRSQFARHFELSDDDLNRLFPEPEAR